MSASVNQSRLINLLYKLDPFTPPHHNPPKNSFHQILRLTMLIFSMHNYLLDNSKLFLHDSSTVEERVILLLFQNLA